jgi:hypothetical protein
MINGIVTIAGVAIYGLIVFLLFPFRVTDVADIENIENIAD